MRTHTSDFKQAIKELGRVIDGKIFYYPNYNLISEDDETILTEADIELVSEQYNNSSSIEIDSELIYSMELLKNGNLLKSLMKQFNFEAKYEINIGSVVNPKFGLEVSGSFEYLDYGKYVIYSKEYNLDSETWSYVCYDMMLYSMIKYIPMSSVTYPITIRDFIGEIANKMGVGFASSNDSFVNYNQLINEELFENKGYTIRDILDKLSQITASNILINEDNELEVAYVNDTQDTIDEEYLKDVNVAFGKVFGPINRISIADTENELEYYAEDPVSISEAETTQINIIDNELATNGEEQNMCNAILNELKGLYYSLNDFSTIGVCYYDFLDLFNVEAKGETYKCLLLNNEISFSQGITESIFTEEPEDNETSGENYETSVMSDKTVTFKINQQERRLEQAVKQDDIIASLNLAIEDGQGVVNLKGNTVTIDSDHFKLAEDGSVSIDNGAVSLNNKGIQMADGTSIIGGNGMLTQFHYSGSGKCGFTTGASVSWRNAVYLAVYIPSNFSVVNAQLVITHNPGYTYQYNESTSGYQYYTCYVRNAKLYYTTTKRRSADGNFSNETAPTNEGTVISTISDSGSKTFSSTATETVVLDLETEQLTTGNQFLYIADYTDSVPTNYLTAFQKSGYITMDLFVSGYVTTRNE